MTHVYSIAAQYIVDSTLSKSTLVFCALLICAVLQNLHPVPALPVLVSWMALVGDDYGIEVDASHTNPHLHGLCASA